MVTFASWIEWMARFRRLCKLGFFTRAAPRAPLAVPKSRRAPDFEPWWVTEKNTVRVTRFASGVSTDGGDDAGPVRYL